MLHYTCWSVSVSHSRRVRACRLVAIRLESLVCPHFASSLEWLPTNNVKHLQTLHLYNNFFDYPEIKLLVTLIIQSPVTSLDLGQHRMLVPETLAIVEALVAPTCARHLKILRLDVSKYSQARNLQVEWDTLSTASHLATNVRRMPTIATHTPVPTK